MRKRAPTFDTVRELGRALPNTEEGTAWGTPVLRVNGTIYSGIPIHKSAEPGSVMFRVAFDDRDLLIEEQPEVYYTASHYEKYPCVLVRLTKIDRGALADLVRMAHGFASRSRSRKGRTVAKKPKRPRR